VNRLFGALLLVFSVAAFAQAPHVRSGSTVYIEPDNGYETYFAAAFAKKHVPLVVVMDKSKAQYVITSTVEHTVPNQPAVVVNNTHIVSANSDNRVGHSGGYAALLAAQGSTASSVSLIDPQSSQALWALLPLKSIQTSIDFPPCLVLRETEH
jgi:hypothetical protein